MVKTSREQLGQAYILASADLFHRHGHMSPREMGAFFREEYGLHHRTARIIGGYQSWIEFPRDADYTAFVLRWA